MDLRWLGPVVLAALLAPVALQSARRGWADWRMGQARGLEDLEEACRLDPARADCLAAVARAREQQAQDASRDWQRVLALNPRNASYLSEAALAAEFRGDTAAAERLLLQAARFNRLWLPRWSLANFYFRHGRERDFRHWVAQSFERAYGDRTALFRLCRSAGIDDGQMLTQVLGEDPRNLESWVQFLTSEGPVHALPAAAREFTRRARPGDLNAVRTLNLAIMALLRNGVGASAPPIWSAMARRGLIPYPEWRENAPLVNAAFRMPLPGSGLDWQVPPLAGVEVFPGVPVDGIKFTFSGRQPESAELLAQDLILRGGQSWTLSFEYQTPGVSGAASSLAWQLSNLPAVGAPPRLSSEEWRRAEVTWDVPEGLQVLRLALRSDRPRGQTRHEGELRLRELSLSPSSRGR